MGKPSGKRVLGFVLRSGYVVPITRDTSRMIDHLRNAIIGESFEMLKAKRNKGWKAVEREILAEITHLATTMPPQIAQGLLFGLLSDAVFERLREVSEQHAIQAPPITDKIQ